MKKIKDIKKVVSSTELPMDKLKIDTIMDIFDVIAVLELENYILFINASGKKIDNEV